MNAADVRAALLTHYPRESHAVMFEVGQGTGTWGGRYADAVVMSLWPSRGLEVIGIEIKVSRGDWMREVMAPEKSDAIQRYCDRWFIATPKGLVKPAELPSTWGLLEVTDDGRVRAAQAAPKLKPLALDRAFVAAMLRRASNADAAMVSALVEKQLAPRIRSAVEDAMRQHRRDSEEHARRERWFSEFKEATGVDIETWRPAATVAQAFKFAIDSGLTGQYGLFEQAASHAERLAKMIREALPTKGATA